MINVRRTMRGSGERVDVNMSPLIDMVFLLLIFFVVTTSFVKETGVDVTRATAATAETVAATSIMIAVTEDGDVWMEGKRVDVRSVRGLVERSLAEDPEAAAVIVADRDSRNGLVVEVMDQCRLAGAANVSLAARRGDGQD
jgi:biopolymer transport protein ExbD